MGIVLGQEFVAPLLTVRDKSLPLPVKLF